MLRTLSQLSATALVLLGLTLVLPDRAASTPLMHLRLTKSLPAKDSVLATAPATISLWFSEPPMVKVSSIRLTGPEGPVKLGAVAGSPDDVKLLTAAVEGTMHHGDYTISWRAASDDGHVLRGTVPFAYRPE